MSLALSVNNMRKRLCQTLLSALGFIVFLFLDFLDSVLCIIYRYLDEFFEGKADSCYCQKKGEELRNVGDDDKCELSETFYGRRNAFRQIWLLGFGKRWEESKNRYAGESMVNRWSDCGCEDCVSWMRDGHGHMLHVVVREPSRVLGGESIRDSTENVIFLHGFLSSSSFWTETVFPNTSQTVKHNYRLFAIDLLGFGKSPKPRDCLYTLRDHLEMMEKSVINPFELKSFHLVAHSMGCIIALALAAKYPTCVKSITLIAPPYFPGSKEGSSLMALEKLAGKTLWPPLLFGSSFMSWYEHLGRCVCLLVCRNHRTWERILKLLTWKRDLHFILKDLTKHTHHSAWHTMHNVICGGAKLMDDFLETLRKHRVKLCVIQGDCDDVVPLECSRNIKTKVAAAEVNIISNADHWSVIIGRDSDFTQYLEQIWASADCDLKAAHQNELAQ